MTTKCESLTVHELRSRWKPHKERLQAEREDHPTCIRFHRACSWLAKVEELPKETETDMALIGQWIGFNCLYGQWNEAESSPLPDRESWRGFLERILEIDGSGHVSAVLLAHKNLVLSILDDKYLSSFFWQEPTDKRAGHARRTKQDAQGWYRERRWGPIIERTVDRIYLLRCQLVHGAATHGGQLNRDSLRHCSVMLSHLLPALLLAWIDHGADEDWGRMCYPPLT